MSPSVSKPATPPIFWTPIYQNLPQGWSLAFSLLLSTKYYCHFYDCSVKEVINKTLPCSEFFTGTKKSPLQYTTSTGSLEGHRNTSRATWIQSEFSGPETRKSLSCLWSSTGSCSPHPQPFLLTGNPTSWAQAAGRAGLVCKDVKFGEMFLHMGWGCCPEKMSELSVWVLAFEWGHQVFWGGDGPGASSWCSNSHCHCSAPKTLLLTGPQCCFGDG